MEYKIKKLYFGDIRKVAQTINQLGLSAKQIRSLYDVFNDIQTQTSFNTIEQAEAYLRQNLTKEQYNEVKGLDEKEKMVKAAEIRFEKTNVVDNVIEQAVFLVGIVATKFDVIVDFMDYFIENVTAKQILAFEGDDTKKALVAIFRNAGFLQYFKSMFN